MFSDSCGDAFIEEVHHFRVAGNELVRVQSNLWNHFDYRLGWFAFSQDLLLFHMQHKMTHPTVANCCKQYCLRYSFNKRSVDEFPQIAFKFGHTKTPLLPYLLS